MAKQNSWLHQILEDFSWLRLSHHAFQRMLVPSSDFGAWVRRVNSSRGSWLRAVREVTKAVVAKAR
eukprot:1667540-Pyramimonas_sp.AAC.2